MLPTQIRYVLVAHLLHAKNLEEIHSVAVLVIVWCGYAAAALKSTGRHTNGSSATTTWAGQIWPVHDTLQKTSRGPWEPPQVQHLDTCSPARPRLLISSISSLLLDVDVVPPGFSRLPEHNHRKSLDVLLPPIIPKVHQQAATVQLDGDVVEIVKRGSRSQRQRFTLCIMFRKATWYLCII
eukprot:GHVS01034162.1.p1 GENE.GHVS01034162.1~~GHVS01034162.1.p1  ORF type:complete len:181 (-),score=9.99 GHVS01034162.1:16-558(-)